MTIREVLARYKSDFIKYWDESIFVEDTDLTLLKEDAYVIAFYDENAFSPF